MVSKILLFSQLCPIYISNSETFQILSSCFSAFITSAVFVSVYYYVNMVTWFIVQLLILCLENAVLTDLLAFLWICG